MATKRPHFAIIASFLVLFAGLASAAWPADIIGVEVFRQCPTVTSVESTDLNILADPDIVREFIACEWSGISVRAIADPTFASTVISEFLDKLTGAGLVVDSSCDNLGECAETIETECRKLPLPRTGKSASLSVCPTPKKNADSTCCTGTCSDNTKVTRWCIHVLPVPRT